MSLESVSNITMKVFMTFLMCLVMLQYMCHAKSACNNRHPKLCILHPGKRGFLTNDKTVNQAVDFDRTEFTQPKWLQDEFAKSAELENLFGDMEDDQEEEEDDFIPFNDDRFDYTQALLTQGGIDHLKRREQILRILSSLVEEDLSYRQ